MKVTLITGASGGIGEAFARRLAGEHHNLLLIARSESKLKELCEDLAKRHKIEAQYIAIDLALPNADQYIFDETQKRNLQVEWLINNAGVGSGGDFIRLDLPSEFKMIQLNISTLVGLTQRYLNIMREENAGTIINVGSVASFTPTPFQATYAASKAFVRSFTEALVAENIPFNIRIMLLCPGLTESNFFENGRMSEADKKTLSHGFAFQSPSAVVDEALSGLSKVKTKVISGFRNRLLVFACYFLPNSLLTKLGAKGFRSNFQ